MCQMIFLPLSSFVFDYILNNHSYLLKYPKINYFSTFVSCFGTIKKSKSRSYAKHLHNFQEKKNKTYKLCQIFLKKTYAKHAHSPNHKHK